MCRVDQSSGARRSRFQPDQLAGGRRERRERKRQWASWWGSASAAEPLPESRWRSAYCSTPPDHCAQFKNTRLVKSCGAKVWGAVLLAGVVKVALTVVPSLRVPLNTVFYGGMAELALHTCRDFNVKNLPWAGGTVSLLGKP